MEAFIQITLYVRVFALISLFALCILSVRHFFKHHRRFWFGLLLNLGMLIPITAISYFMGTDASILLAAIGFTPTLILWAILWTIDLANNGRP